jgi:hypothetical protein
MRLSRPHLVRPCPNPRPTLRNPHAAPRTEALCVPTRQHILVGKQAFARNAVTCGLDTVTLFHSYDLRLLDDKNSSKKSTVYEQNRCAWLAESALGCRKEAMR